MVSIISRICNMRWERETMLMHMIDMRTNAKIKLLEHN